MSSRRSLISPVNLKAILEATMAGGSLAAGCRAVGISEQTGQRWQRLSREGDERFLVDWIEGEEPMMFHEAVDVAYEVIADRGNETILSMSRGGFAEPVIYEGELQYMRDPVTKELERDPITGRPIPLTVVKADTVFRATSYLQKVLHRRRFGDRQEVELSGEVKGGGTIAVPMVAQSPEEFQEAVRRHAERLRGK